MSKLPFRQSIASTAATSATPVIRFGQRHRQQWPNSGRTGEPAQMTAPGRGCLWKEAPELPLGHPVNFLLSAYGHHVELTQSARP